MGDERIEIAPRSLLFWLAVLAATIAGIGLYFAFARGMGPAVPPSVEAGK